MAALREGVHRSSPMLTASIQTRQKMTPKPHESPVEDFPKQPSQKDGLGRMCKIHWNQYTAGLARDAKARKAATEEGEAAVGPDVDSVASKSTRPRRKVQEPIDERSEAEDA